MRGEQACIILLNQKQLWEALIDKELSDKWNLAGSSSARQVVLVNQAIGTFDSQAVRLGRQLNINNQSVFIDHPIN